MPDGSLWNRFRKSNNPTPNSVNCSRPLALIFEKESDDLCRYIKNKIVEDLGRDMEFIFDCEGIFFDFSANINAFFTAIDGKMLNSAICIQDYILPVFGIGT